MRQYRASKCIFDERKPANMSHLIAHPDSIHSLLLGDPLTAKWIAPASLCWSAEAVNVRVLWMKSMPPVNWATETPYFYRCCHGSGMHWLHRNSRLPKLSQILPETLFTFFFLKSVYFIILRKANNKTFIFLKKLNTYNVLKTFKSLNQVYCLSVMLMEISHVEKDKNRMTSLICGI